MKKIFLKIICAVIAMILLIVVVDLNTDVIKRNINKTVPVEIYNEQGEKSGTSLITINGTYYPHLFRSDIYFGQFSLPELPETERTDTNAEIEWIKRRGYPDEPRIIHYGPNIYENLGSVYIDINKNMDVIVWWTSIGTVASSYEEYSKSMFYKG